MRCSAPWYELNISAPDNVVSACCYYAGDKDPWHDGVTDIRTYWNSKALREIRRIHGGCIHQPEWMLELFLFSKPRGGRSLL